jgi:hypothetical protein
MTAIPMKTKPARSPSLPKPSEEDIRDFAYHLYQQGGGVPGHALDDWLEATACLNANIPAFRSRTRLHRHVNRLGNG